MSDALTYPNESPKQHVDLAAVTRFSRCAGTVFPSYRRGWRGFSCRFMVAPCAGLPKRSVRFSRQFSLGNRLCGDRLTLLTSRYG